jgi:hypothetical protein
LRIAARALGAAKQLRWCQEHKYQGAEIHSLLIDELTFERQARTTSRR